MVAEGSKNEPVELDAEEGEVSDGEEEEEGEENLETETGLDQAAEAQVDFRVWVLTVHLVAFQCCAMAHEHDIIQMRGFGAMAAQQQPLPPLPSFDALKLACGGWIRQDKEPAKDAVVSESDPALPQGQSEALDPDDGKHGGAISEGREREKEAGEAADEGEGEDGGERQEEALAGGGKAADGGEPPPKARKTQAPTEAVVEEEQAEDDVQEAESVASESRPPSAAGAGRPLELGLPCCGEEARG